MSKWLDSTDTINGRRSRRKNIPRNISHVPINDTLRRMMQGVEPPINEDMTNLVMMNCMRDRASCTRPNSEEKTVDTVSTTVIDTTDIAEISSKREATE
ncbi:hypothetical protein LIER_23966 [Lithospermum erythrorhizon]|uniref:Uncharacterized protein n=1 Tax=Lithospermum erythrorhizon TaxID=34254 RepID=A0AAV3QZB3_LITER